MNCIEPGPPADSTQRDAKPAACRACGGRAGVEHIVETAPPAASVVPLLSWALAPMTPQPRRYAQVTCRVCDARGPRVLFVTSDEWPHIAAERDAVAGWNGLHLLGLSMQEFVGFDETKLKKEKRGE